MTGTMGAHDLHGPKEVDSTVVSDGTELNPEDKEPERETWDNQCEFFLSCLGYAVGFGNVWRFPYLAYKNGGAVFLIPYVTMLFCAGLPLFFLELALGQYVSLGPNVVFKKVAPILSGLGWGMIVISTLVAVYYNMILAWTFFYTFATFEAFFPVYTGILPWSHCNGDFNSLGCFTGEGSKECAANGTMFYNNTCMSVEMVCNIHLAIEHNATHCEEKLNGSYSDFYPVERTRISASEDYFKNRMLGVTGTTWDSMGNMRWELVGCLALSWVVVCLCMIKGVKSSGKVVYFTALFPYVVLVILLVRGVTLPGAYKGIEFYFLKPDLSKLANIEVWNDAATQIFYSLGSSFGGLITLASYNKFKNNCMRDAIVIAICNCTTSVFAGFVIFSILGFMATELGKDVADVVTSGSGLAFVAYPEAVTKMPISPLWALLFFTMLVTLGLDSQFTMVETISTAIFDEFEFLRPKKPLVVVIMCFILFLCGLTMCLDGGIYMFELFNGYSAGLSVIVLAFLEIIAIQYIYGFKNFIRNITQGMGIYMPIVLYGYWAITWLFITPATLIVIFCLSLYFWAPVGFGSYVFPQQIQALGWVVCGCSVILVPIFAIYFIYKNRKDGDNIKKLFQTSEDFCPITERRLRARKGAALKGKPEGSYRYIRDNEGFDDSVVRVYPRIRDSETNTFDNPGFNESEARAYSRGGMDNPPPYVPYSSDGYN